MNRRALARQAAEALRSDLQVRLAAGAPNGIVQLPTERELAVEYRLSRNTVRRVLNRLEEAGWIERHVGRGTFARPRTPHQEVVPSPTILVDSRSVNPEEVMEARLLIEPQLARLIVARATETELEELGTIVRAGASADSMEQFEHWDNKLHRAIVQASKNKYLIQIIEGIHDVRQSSAWSRLRRRGLTSERRARYQQDHEHIVAALQARDGPGAEQAISEHLNNVRRNLLLI